MSYLVITTPHYTHTITHPPQSFNEFIDILDDIIDIIDDTEGEISLEFSSNS